MISELDNLPDVALYAGAFGASLLIVVLLTPLAARLATRCGVVAQSGLGRLHGTVTPCMGGLAVAAGLLAVAALSPGLEGQVVTILVCALAVALLGLADDWVGVHPLPKLIVEVGVGLALWIAGIRAGLFGVPALDLALTVFWVLAITNAVNLIDNIDGVAGGISAISAIGFFAIALGNDDRLVATLSVAIAGASIGFLRQNFPPAKIFLGDAGSLLLGFLLAALGLQLDLVGETGVTRVTIPLLVLAVPLLDTLLVVIARVQGGRRIYVGGRDHASHRLVARGLSVRSTAIALYAVQIVCAATAVVLLDAPGSAILLAAVFSFAFALVALLFLLRTTPIEQTVGAEASRPVASAQVRVE